MLRLAPDGSSLHALAGKRLDESPFTAIGNIATFERDLVTGALTLVDVINDLEGTVRGLSFFVDLAITPDGAQVFIVVTWEPMNPAAPVTRTLSARRALRVQEGTSRRYAPAVVYDRRRYAGQSTSPSSP